MMPFHRPTPESKQRGKPDGLFGAWVQAEKLMQIALVLPCATFIGWLAGFWLDRHFNQSWIAVAGIVFGGASGLVYVVRLALDANKDPAMQDKAGDEPKKDNADKSS